jgi:hypothetical protein
MALRSASLAETIWQFPAILLPQGPLRHTRPLELPVHARPIRSCACRTIVRPCRYEQPPLELGVADLLISGDTGQVMPIALARVTDSPTAVLLTELVRKRSTSRIFLIDTLFFGIDDPRCFFLKGVPIS